ncbi:MAG: carboxypeptidase regulatory-like domain-containing protein [Daejeonella sp.]|uniref:carboxypeptidase regulatory-like domain-containing protein n=1 Tax=Daejeonella sp. TaxID=2805397 RepID=UPI0027334E31|nr:carboxypeptidase regulatory-like domain-containing protein [Daejeonella sp.]MDP3468723.1 carboxypeptidase regulatory-like domain-containing protein [Daejeonella sp.]
MIQFKMKVCRSLFIVLLFLLQAGQLYAQDTISLKTIVDRSQKLIEDYPSEKVYLHFDKPYYAVGDTIWFKAYVATGQDLPSDLSKVLYVDIISENDTLIRSMKLPVVNTSAYGSITLDPTIYKSSNYRIRAYTYWMLNFSDEYFFTKTITVGNAINRNIITTISLRGENPDTSPLINAKIVFKDPDGKPFANKRLSWSLISRFETIARGRETTNADGMVTLKLSAGQKAALDTGILETVLEAETTKLISSKFPLKNSFAGADLQFFPEGGDLLENVSTKVAFKALQEKGLGLDVKGEIVDNTGKVISSIQSQHLGMGSFTLLPETGKSYKANLNFSNGLKKTIPLPEIKPSGISLAVLNSTPTNIILQLSATQSFFDKNHDKNFYLIARSKGVICFAAQTNLATINIGASLPKNKFPTGIVQITLFTNKGEPLTERLIFVNHTDVSSISINTDKKVYGSRQPVKMNINAKSNNVPVEGNFSLSVINETKVPHSEDEETTILSSFLLSSELTGYIEKPNYYFNQTNDKKLADLDLLMLTQGYRKFSYEDIIKDREPVISVLPEQGIEFSGILRTSNGMPVSKGSLKLVVPESRFYAETATNLKGEFKFEKVMITDSAEATISARSSTAAQNMMIMLNGTAFPTNGKNINAADEELNIDSALATYLDNSKRQYFLATQMLQEVVVTATATKKASHMDHPALSGLGAQADHVIDGERFKGCTILLNCLQTATAGLTFNNNNFYVTRVYNSGLRVPVQIFFNGMPVDANYLNNINPADVDNIEVFLRDELGMVNRMYNTNGVLVINSKVTPKGTPVSAEELRKLFPQNNVLTFNPHGYIKKREFYSPKYLSPESRTTGSDLRSTIYWNPRIFTDKAGNMAVEFYNGDNKGTYKAIVEGTDIDGNLSRYIYRYKVE